MFIEPLLGSFAKDSAWILQDVAYNQLRHIP